MKAGSVQKVIVLLHDQKKEKQLSIRDTDMEQH